MVILTKDLLGAVFWNFGSFSGALCLMPQIFPHFSSLFSNWGMPCWYWVSLRSVGGTLRLIRRPPNLLVTFKAMKQLAEVPPMHLDLAHYRQHVPWLKKWGKFLREGP